MTETPMRANTGSLLDGIPKSVLQAIYHTVTGKVENQTTTLRSNVEIRRDDIVRLFGMLQQQLEHYEAVADPAVTVIVRDSNDRSLTYSSWERFQTLEVESLSVTSEMIIKVEFLIQIINTPAPQRCIITIDLDSGLPVLSNDKPMAIGFLDWFSEFASDWPAAKVSIDFVDFLVARNLQAGVTEWFNGLRKAETPPFSKSLQPILKLMRLFIPQMGRIGFAAFIMTYLAIAESPLRLISLVQAGCLGLVLWSITNAYSSSLSNYIGGRIALSLMPGVILLTEGDQRAYDAAKKRMKGVGSSLAYYVLALSIQIALNVAASYIYEISKQLSRRP